MKKSFVILLLLVMSSFVMAVGSDISAEFIVGDEEVVARDYVPTVTFWDTYGAYIIGVVIVLIIVIVFAKTRKRKVVRKIKKKKSRKRK